MPSTASEISRVDRRSVPLKSRCSMKWQTPLSFDGSWREPTPTHKPRLTLAMCGISAVATVNPFSRRVMRYISGKSLGHNFRRPDTPLVVQDDAHRLLRPIHEGEQVQVARPDERVRVQHLRSHPADQAVPEFPAVKNHRELRDALGLHQRED